MSPFALLPVVLSLAAALLLTPAVRALARRWGMVAQPKADRWHKTPTALLGGLAIGAAVLPCSLLLPLAPQAAVILAAGGLCGLVGLVDDFLRIKPYQKLIGQVLAAALVVAAGLTLPWTPWPLLNIAVTLFWLIGVTNAVNLLDNMDGLAAGVGLIAAVFLAVHFATEGQAAEALLLGVFAAALAGFLVYNVNPASIFMGDCGSLFIGFFLAGATLLGLPGGRSQTVLPVLAVPVLILLVPIFDTTLVTVLRKLAGRSISQGGRDHTSHRLVALGMSERRAVGVLYALATVAGLLALLARSLELTLSVTLAGAFTVVLTLLGVYLAGVKVYDEAEVAAAQKKPVVAFLIDLSHKRRLFEVLLDVVFIMLAYAGSQALVLGPGSGAAAEERLIRVVAVLVLIKTPVLLTLGVYRGLWRYVSVEDFVVFAKAVGLASLVGVAAVLLLFGVPGFSRTVFVLDGLALFALIAGSRLAFRVFRRLLPAPQSGGRRVLIYGAGDAGELLLREIRNNPRLGCVPVGFADDDPMKKGKRLHGLTVLGGNGSLPGICREHRVEAVYVSSCRIGERRVREILAECRGVGVEVKRMRIVIEPLVAPLGGLADTQNA